ncbi:MAG: tRNA uracil 4-sulfurtransferase ThiI [Pseudomonadota bacterium]
MTGEHPFHPAIALKAGELYLKGGNRPAFVKILLANARKIIGRDFPQAVVGGRVGTFLVSGCGHDPRLVLACRRIFGVSLVEEVLSCDTDMEAVKKAAAALMEPFSGPGASFKVAAKRAWKKFPLTSTQVNREVGEAIVTRFGLKVDLKHADITLKISVDSDKTILSTSTHEGAGGLPVGCSGRGLALLSGGIDSPVAGWLAMRRGIRIDCLHFHSPPYTGAAALKKVEDLARVLRQYDPAIALHAAAFTRAQELVREKVREDYRVVMYRRLMLRVAAALAGRLGAEVLITGESIGQVASQTLANMACIDKAALFPIIRPLVTYDKAETIRLARGLGTYEISIRKGEDCCSLFVPEHPATRAKDERCREYEDSLDTTGIVDECLDSIETSL